MLSVALCTYNGERYIKEQLESLMHQTMMPDELVISDDGSKDATLRIVREFAMQAPFPVRIYEQPSLGTTANFSEAIAQCCGDYIALCDQDDVWLPDKLLSSMEMIKSQEERWSPDCPLLVHGDLCVVNERLKVLQPSMMAAQGICDEPVMKDAFAVLLVQNYVTGCTVLFNKALKVLACPFPSHIVMHDWWLALMAAAAGQIGFLAQSHILYRQHGDNQVGAKKFFSWENMVKVFGVEKIRQQMKTVLQQDMSLKERMGESVCPAAVLTERYLSAIKERSAWCCTSSLGIHKQKYIRDIFFRFFLFIYRRDFADLLEGRE